MANGQMMTQGSLLGMLLDLESIGLGRKRGQVHCEAPDQLTEGELRREDCI